MIRCVLLLVPVVVSAASYTPLEAVKWSAQWSMRLSSLRARIEQTLVTPATRETYEATYESKVPSRIRLDYTKPYKQTVVVNGSEFSWFIPSQGKVWYDDGARQKIQTELRKLLAQGPDQHPIEDPGDFVYVFGPRSLRDQLAGLCVVDFAPRTKADISMGRIWIDPHQWLVKRVEIYDPNQKLMVVEERSDYVAVADQWVPGRVTIRNWTPQGLTKVVTRYSAIEVNVPIPDDRFRLEIPPTVVRVPLSR